MARTLSLFDGATAKGRVMRQGEIIQMVMDGSGAFVCPAMDFLVAQKWAQSKTASTNVLTDRGRFIEKIEILIARPNSVVSTRGSTRPLVMLAKQMVQNGYDLSEWVLPFDVKQELKVKIDQPKAKSAAESESAEGSAPQAPPPPPQPVLPTAQTGPIVRPLKLN